MSGNTTSLYSTSSSNGTTGSNNFTTLYPSTQGVLVPTTPYGNANVVALLAAGTDGANTVGNISATGNVTAGNIIAGNIYGNIVGNLVVPGATGEILYNNAGNAAASPNLTFNSATSNLTVTGNINFAQTSGLITNGSDAIELVANVINQTTGLYLQDGGDAALFANNNVIIESLDSLNWTFDTTGNLTLPTNTANINYANGVSILTSTGGAYGNANVANFLPTFGGNVNASTVFHNTTGVALQSNAWAQLQYTGSLSAPADQTNIGNGSWLYVDAAGAAFESNVTGTFSSVFFGNDGQTSASGNITGQNLITAGVVSAGGNVRGGNINTIGLITATGNVYGNYFIGNGSQLTGLPATYSNANVATFLANFGSNSISTTGNITGGLFTGNGAGLTNINAGNIIGSYGNANVIALLSAFGSNTISTTGNVVTGNLTVQSDAVITGNLTVNGNTTTVHSNVVTIDDKFINVANNAATAAAANGGGLGVGPQGSEYATLTYNSTANAWNTNIAISATGNVSGTYILGNGSQLTGLPASYSNANVTSLLAAFGSNSISTTGNVTASYLIGNGALLTSITGANVSGTVANATYAFTANTATYANIVMDAAQPNITSVGTLTSLSVSGNATAGNLLTPGVVSATGNATAGNLLTAGVVSATGNVTGAWVIGNTALQARNTSVIGNIVAAPGNIVLSKVLGSDGIYAPEAATANAMANGQIIMGYGYNGNVNANALSINTQGQGARFLVWDHVQRGNNAGTGGELNVVRASELTANVTNASFREIALAGRLSVGGGSAANTALTTNPFFFNALNGRISVGNDGSGANIGNTTLSHATAMVATMATYPGSNTGNSLCLLLNNQSAAVGSSGGNVTNMIGLGFFGAQNIGNAVGNYYGIAHTGTTNTFGYTVPATIAAQTTNYYLIYNTDNVIQNQLGQLRSYQETNYTSGTSGTVNVDKTNGQVQTIVPTGNITVGSFTNFITTASATANSITKTAQQTDTVTLIIKQGATPYTITMPTGNAQIKYAGNITTLANTANAVTMVAITGANISGTVNYMVTVSPEFV